VSAAAAKVVLVTGASGGVGRGIALACGAAGWHVWIAARRQQEGERVAAEVDAAGGRGRFIAFDVADAVSVRAGFAAVVERDGRLDGAVHSATSGLSGHPVRLAEVPVADLRDHAAVSVRGSWLVAVHAFPHLRAAGGSLVLLTSEAGFEGKARLAPYAGVKGMQRGMTRALAREWGPAGVRVNAMAPLANSPAMEGAMQKDPQMAERIFARNPLGRMGDPVAEIGAAARFLLSDDARYVTGHTLMVDGGSCPAS